MHADRGDVGGIADHRHHLAEAALLAACDQLLHDQLAEPAALRLGIEIDRVLDAEAIGWARPVRSGIGVADDSTVELGGEIRKFAVGEAAKPPGHLGKIRRVELEGRGAEADGVFVDGGDGGEIGLGGGPDV